MDQTPLSTTQPLTWCLFEYIKLDRPRRKIFVKKGEMMNFFKGGEYPKGGIKRGGQIRLRLVQKRDLTFVQGKNTK